VAAIKAGFHAVKRGERKKARQAWKRERIIILMYIQTRS
jgi:hypothetical protein